MNPFPPSLPSPQRPASLTVFGILNLVFGLIGLVLLWIGLDGLLWGAYHFAHPGLVEPQVDHFLSVAGVHDDMLYAFDWETSSTGAMNESQAVEFLQLLEAKTGRKGVVYSGNVAKEKIYGTSSYLGSHRLWLAQYSAHPKTQKSWKTWWLWQYSDGEVGPNPHGCPGVSGRVDTNAWAGTDAELRQQWSGIGATV